MNNIVVQIQQSTNSEQDLKSLKTFLQKQEEFLIKNPNLIDGALDVLADVNRYTVGFIYLLAVKAISQRGDNQKFISQVLHLLANCAPELVRHAARKFAGICRKFTETLIEVRQPMRGILPLKAAITVLVGGNPSQLTSVHADFVLLCLIAKTYRTALPVLQEDIFEVNPEETGVSPKDLLSYYYYGGIVYLGMKQYTRAIDFFKNSFCAPAMVLSSIALEAYKKFILASLIKFGTVIPVPKYIPAVVHRHAKTAAAQYHEFATAYATHNPDDVHRVAAQHAELFQKDGNFGLVKQAIKSLNRNNVRRLTQTYLTLSLSDIKDTVKLPTVAEAERSLFRMIEEGDIFAQINQRDGMVAFLDNPERHNSDSSLANLDTNIHSVMSLEKRLKATEEMLALSPQYVQKLLGQERRGGQWAEMGGIMDEQTLLELSGMPAGAFQKFM